jgi:hypothetical protein
LQFIKPFSIFCFFEKRLMKTVLSIDVIIVYLFFIFESKGYFQNQYFGNTFINNFFIGV